MKTQLVLIIEKGDRTTRLVILVAKWSSIPTWHTDEELLGAAMNRVRAL